MMATRAATPSGSAARGPVVSAEPARGTWPGQSATATSPAALRERRPGGPARPSVGSPPPVRIRDRRVRPAARRLPNMPSVRLAPLLDSLLRGRAWVALIALLLTGIVFLNVSLLELNRGIARTDARAADLRRDNSALRMRVARLSSSERIQRTAAARGFVPARPGQVGYLRLGGDAAAGAARALEDWRPPEPPRAPPGPADGNTSGAEAAPAAPLAGGVVSSHAGSSGARGGATGPSGVR